MEAFEKNTLMFSKMDYFVNQAALKIYPLVFLDFFDKSIIQNKKKIITVFNNYLAWNMPLGYWKNVHQIMSLILQLE